MRQAPWTGNVELQVTFPGGMKACFPACICLQNRFDGDDSKFETYEACRNPLDSTARRFWVEFEGQSNSEKPMIITYPEDKQKALLLLDAARKKLQHASAAYWGAVDDLQRLTQSTQP